MGRAGPDDLVGSGDRGSAGVVAAAGSNAGQVIAVGVTGQMHSAVLLDGSGRVLRPAILWCDRRSAPEAATAQRDFPAFVETTGNPPLPAFTLTKLLWIRHHEPDVYRRVRAVLVPKDHLRLRLTGESATEPSDASGTAMFDVRSRTWSGPIIEQFGIPRSGCLTASSRRKWQAS